MSTLRFVKELEDSTTESNVTSSFADLEQLAPKRRPSESRTPIALRCLRNPRRAYFENRVAFPLVDLKAGVSSRGVE